MFDTISTARSSYRFVLTRAENRSARSARAPAGRRRPVPCVPETVALVREAREGQQRAAEGSFTFFQGFGRSRLAGHYFHLRNAVDRIQKAHCQTPLTGRGVESVLRVFLGRRKKLTSLLVTSSNTASTGNLNVLVARIASSRQLAWMASH